MTKQDKERLEKINTMLTETVREYRAETLRLLKVGDFSNIKTSFVVILKEFNETLNEIKEVSTQVDTGSDEVAGAANDLANGTNEQAGSVEELTATIETVSNMAQKSAKDAIESYEKMLLIVKEAETEKRQMEELTVEMHRIMEINKGNKVTEETAEGFERIIGELENFAKTTKETSEMAKEQSQALLQVERGVNQISLITSGNAVSSQECSAISEELAARAEELDNLVDRFKLYG